MWTDELCNRINSKPKKNIGDVFLVIIVVLFIFGLGGYYAFTKGHFNNFYTNKPEIKVVEKIDLEKVKKLDKKLSLIAFVLNYNSEMIRHNKEDHVIIIEENWKIKFPEYMQLTQEQMEFLSEFTP